MRKSVEVNGTAYRSKSEVARKAESILNGTPVGLPISPEDREFVISLLYLRNEETVKIKTGTGIVAVSPMHPNGFENCRTFCLHRSDGTWTDFSYRKALECVNNASYVKRAARYEVRCQIEEFKAGHFDGQCSVTGEPITLQTCHVDHIPPDTFDVLFAAFLKREGVNIKNVEAAGVGDRQIGTVFVDRGLADRWREYHLRHAKLRIVSARANLALVEKARGDYDGNAA